jgi:uncharacterized membrane protein
VGERRSDPDGETPDGGDSAAVAINDRGDVAGTVSGDGAFTQPARWHHGRLERLPLPAGVPGGSAIDVNEAGQVLVSTSEGVANQGYLLTGDRLRPLGIPPGDIGFIPFALNDRAEVAGAGNSGLTGKVWRNGRFIAVQARGFQFTFLLDLDNQDVLVGAGTAAATFPQHPLIWS